MAVRVTGLRELSRAFAAAGRDASKELRGELREVAEPIRRAAEVNVSGITRIGPKWSRMRVGVTRTLVYVAPKQRGVKGKGAGGRRRPNLADQIAPRMERALASNRHNIEAAAERALDRIGREWEHRG